MRPPKKGCVEDCLCLWIHRMPKGRNILRWRQGKTEIASLEYERGANFVRFRAQIIALKPQPQSVHEHQFALTTAACLPGIEIQYYLVCPCGRNASKLYIPHGKADFRCRHCHNLTNRSAQIHNGRIGRLARQPATIQQHLAHKQLQSRNLALKASIVATSHAAQPLDFRTPTL